MADGALIHGRYQLLDLIGRGAMGEVWRARDEALGRAVAVKRLKPLGVRHEESFLRTMRERFRREARLAAGLQHPGVTVIHDFGEYEGMLYLVMELLGGRNLSELLRERRPAALAIEDITDIAEQAAEALDYTHAQGIIHRDLKPANVMRLDDGTVKICDFGIARFAADAGLSAKLTSAWMAVGTPHYMSPEQIAGASTVDHRSDLYSLGCVLYELATGAPPFDLGDPWAILTGHRDTPPEPLRTHRPELPESLERLILTLLEKDPDDRPQSAAELARQLAPTRPATGGAEPPGPPVGPEPLPAWAHGMRAGSRASGGWQLRQPPPDRSAGLTSRWRVMTDPRTSRRGRPGPSPEYLAVLASQHNAGLSLGRLGRWDEAREAHQAVAAERARALGIEHPDTLESRYETSYALGRLGRWDEALAGHRQVAKARARLLGPAHQDTLAARYETAVGLSRLGRPAEAVGLYQEVIAARSLAQGPLHPETLRARHGLGVSLGRLGRWEEALAAARQVWAARALVLGSDHLDTLVSRREIAVALGRCQRWHEALEEYRQVRQARQRVLGAGHPDALASRNDEAHCLEQVGRLAEAVELYRQVAALRQHAGESG